MSLVFAMSYVGSLRQRETSNPRNDTIVKLQQYKYVLLYGKTRIRQSSRYTDADDGNSLCYSNGFMLRSMGFEAILNKLNNVKY